MTSRRHLLFSASVLAAVLISPFALSTAQAQDRPIHLIVPYPAGGPLDVTSRALAESVQKTLGTVVVDNKPGAGGNIGADAPPVEATMERPIAIRPIAMRRETTRASRAGVFGCDTLLFDW